MNLYLVDVGYACYGVDVIDDQVIDAPPIARWMIGKSWSGQVVPWLAKKKAKVTLCGQG